MTEDWVKVRGDQLAPRDGVVRSAHHRGAVGDALLRSRLAAGRRSSARTPRSSSTSASRCPPPKLHGRRDRSGPAVRVGARRQGRDVSELARGRDAPLRGLRRPRRAIRASRAHHFVEMELPDAAPRTGPLWLVAQGWIHPTDSSINVAIGQGTHDAPEGLSLQVADAAGRFRDVRTGLGFPAGQGQDDPDGSRRASSAASGPRRLRLRHEPRDLLGPAGDGRSAARMLRSRRAASSCATADLAYRGYSVTEQPSPSVSRACRATRWPAPRRAGATSRATTRGSATSASCCASVDDRYVIMNAGDELRLRFPEAPPPAPRARARLHRRRRRLGEGRRLQHDLLAHRAAAADPRERPLRHAARRGSRTIPSTASTRHDFAEYHTRYVTSDAVRDALARAGEASGLRDR